MSISELLTNNQELSAQIAKAIAEFEDSRAAGKWTITFNHAPGGKLETVTVSGRSMEFRVRGLHR